jgi:hypothetical protein
LAAESKNKTCTKDKQSAGTAPLPDAANNIKHRDFSRSSMLKDVPETGIRKESKQCYPAIHEYKDIRTMLTPVTKNPVKFRNTYWAVSVMPKNLKKSLFQNGPGFPVGGY